MNDDNGAWLLPRLGPLDAANTAIDAVIYALTHKQEPGESASLTPVHDMSSDEATALMNIAGALGNLAALLVKYLDAKTRLMGRPADGIQFLELVKTHQQARADLDSLDRGVPFDE